MKNNDSRSEICPHCEEGILLRGTGSRDIPLDGSLISLANVVVERCPACGFQSVSGRDAALFELLFSRKYASVKDLIRSLRDAGYHDLFLRDTDAVTPLAFSSREYVRTLEDDLRNLYLDNESHLLLMQLHKIRGETAAVEAAGRLYTVRLPRLGEGENGLVYECLDADDSVLKVAKPRPYCREHIRAECEIAELFLSEGIAVPRAIETDPFGSFMVKERIPGRSLTTVYSDLDESDSWRHGAARAAAEEFVGRLLVLFHRFPHAKISISPNNIFMVDDEDSCRCFLVDTGPAPFHDYSNFDFEHYWNRMIPEKLRQYKAAGYL